LKFAVSDALHIRRVFENLGGVNEQDCILLDKPDRSGFFRAFDKIRDRINRNNESNRVEVIVYYSGHSDERNLLMGNERISYYELKMLISQIKADIHIAILDSCASGAFTRIKGGKKKPPFLFDDSNDMQGYAFLTSSSSDEASQESDRLGGSFFTHNLVAGLRGAADSNEDKKVTLNEAYQYAFNETLDQTTKTVSGPQHPNRDIKMSGRGNVILTDISKSESILVLDKQLAGKLFIHDSKDFLVMELRKYSGKALSLGLTKIRHKITLIKDNRTFECSIKFVDSEPYNLHITDFKETDREITQIRGKSRRLFSNLKIRLPKFKNLGFHLYLEMDYSQFESHNVHQSMPGIKLGFIFKNDFYLGFGGSGNISLLTRSNSLGGLYTTAGYGGIEFGYRIFDNLRVSALAGAGMFTMIDEFNKNELGIVSENSKPFFIFEPKVSFLLNIQSSFYLVLSYCKRFVQHSLDMNMGNFKQNKLSFGMIIRI
jgi:hypothetical protein